MKRAWALVACLAACASNESSPPHTEVTPLPSASAAASSEPRSGIGLGSLPPDASMWGSAEDVAQSSGTAHGRLAPEIIQRIVRASFGHTKICYTRALKTTPTLTGRVTTRFVIDIDGNVSSASPEASGTTLPDSQAVDCVVGVFKTLHFPKPDGGSVTVVYPLIFTPSGD